MKNLFGFIAYKIAKKKTQILQALKSTGLVAVIAGPGFGLVLLATFFTNDINTIIMCIMLGCAWMIGAVAVYICGPEIKDKIESFLTEYKHWKNKQVPEK
jgi:hypothetical protein